jgi:hypothetical protein
VVAIRRAVDRFDSHLGCGLRGRDITVAGFGRPHEDRSNLALLESLEKIRFERRGTVGNVDESPRLGRGFQRFREHKRDRLPFVENLIVLQGHDRLARRWARERGELGCIEVREYTNNTRRRGRRRRVDTLNIAAGDRAHDEDGVGDIFGGHIG